MKHNNIWEDLKPLVFFLAGGTFAKLHKMFMEPSFNSTDWAYQVLRWIRAVIGLPGDWTYQVHHWIHFGIGICLQIIIFLWLVKIIGTEFVIPFASFVRKKWRKRKKKHPIK